MGWHLTSVSWCGFVCRSLADRELPRGCAPPCEMNLGRQERGPWLGGAPEGLGPALCKLARGFPKPALTEQDFCLWSQFLGLTQNER